MNRHSSTSRTAAGGALLLAVSALALAACGPSSSSSTPPPSASPRPSSAAAAGAAASTPPGGSFTGTLLFPVAVGNTWVYKTTAAGITTGTTVDKIIRVVPVPGGDRVTTTHAYNGATVRQTLVFNADGSITTPLPSLGSDGTVAVESGGVIWPSQAQINSGQAHTSAIVLRVTIGGQARTITTHVTVRAAGSATVTVPAGQYPTTILDSTMAEKITGVSLSILVRTWLANGVGPVKDEVITDGTVVSGEALKSFTRG
jgi:hypothetical protein